MKFGEMRRVLAAVFGALLAGGAWATDAALRAVAEADRAADVRWCSCDSPEALRALQTEVRAKVVESMGALPAKCPLEARTVARVTRDGYAVEKVIFASEPHHHVTALVFLPDAAKFPGRRPGLVIPCGHSFGGKDLPAYQRGALQAAKRGFVALLFDPLDQGERRQSRGDENRWGPWGHNEIGRRAELLGWSAARFRVRDGVRALDFLAARPEVDPARLGVMGHSGGGTMTAWLMALDERVRCAAPSGYLSTVRDVCNAIGPQDAEQCLFGELAIGLNHLGRILLRAPSPVLMCASEEDFFPIGGALATAGLAARVYGRVGAPDAFRLSHVLGPHHWHESTRSFAVDWMDWKLQGGPAPKAMADYRALDVGFSEEAADCGLSAADARVTPTGAVRDLPDERTAYDLMRDEAARQKAARKALTPETVRRVAGIRRADEIAAASNALLRVEGRVLTVTDDFCEKVRSRHEFYSTSSADEELAVLLHLLGQKLVGRRAEAIIAAAKFAGNRPKLVARGRAAIPAAHAYYTARELFSGVEIVAPPPSWAEYLRDDGLGGRFADVVRGAWAHYDWTDLVGEPYAAEWNGANVALETVRVSSVPFCRVWSGHQRELSQTEVAKTVRLDVARPGALTVRGAGLGAKFRRIRPLSLADAVTISADAVAVKVARAGAFVLEFEDAPTLHVFADAPLGPEPKPAAGGRTIRFAAGEHRAGVVAPASGDVVILEEGAVVHGALQILNATNVTVFGRGVFDASEFGRADPRIRAFHRARGLPEIDTESACFAYSVHGSKDVAIRGVTFRNPPFWTLVIRNQSENVLVDGVKVVGNWRYNSDGIDVCASRNVTIRNSFLRTFDDCLIARGPYLAGEHAPVSGLTVSNCVLWADWGQAFKAQVQDLSGSTVENVAVRDIRVLNLQEALAFLAVRYGSDLDVIRDVTVEDVEIDCVPQLESRIQAKDGEAFSSVPKTGSTLLRLCSYTLGRNMDNQVNGPMEKPDYYRFIHENIAVRNVRAVGEGRAFYSGLVMQVPRHEMRGIVMENVPEQEVTVCTPDGGETVRRLKAGEPFRYGGSAAAASDVCVVGGGASGVAAALAAAKTGARTVLLERSDTLGGTMTNGGVPWAGLFHAWGRQVIAGPGWDLVSNACVRSGFALPDFARDCDWRHWEHQVRFKEDVYAELARVALVRAGVEVRTGFEVASARRADGGWILSDGRVEVRARQVVDCTGNATVAAACGARRVRGEVCQPGSYAYVIDPGCDLKAIDADALQKAWDAALEAGTVRATDCLRRPKYLYLGETCSNHIPGADNSTPELRKEANRRGRESMARMLAFFRAQHGLGGAKVVRAAAETGVRETWRIVGEATVTESDYVAARQFDDAVCHSFYPIDVHTEEGVRPRHLERGKVPTVPFGALVPKGVRDVLVAGRAISSDRGANSALRVQATCMATGQAAGAAAALAARRGVTPGRVPIEEVRAALANCGAIVPLVRGN